MTKNILIKDLDSLHNYIKTDLNYTSADKVFTYVLQQKLNINNTTSLEFMIDKYLKNKNNKRTNYASLVVEVIIKILDLPLNEQIEYQVLLNIDENLFEVDNNKLCYHVIKYKDGYEFIPSKLLNSKLYYLYIKKFPQDFIKLDKDIQTLEMVNYIIKYYNGEYIQYVHFKFLTLELFNNAIINNISTFKLMDKKWQNLNMLNYVLRIEPLFLEYVNKSLITTELCLLAIKNNVNAFKFVDKEYQTLNMINYVLNENPLYLEYVNQNLISSDLYLSIVKNNIDTFPFIDKQNQTEEIINYVLDEKPLYLKYINEKLITKQMCVSAVKKDFNVFKLIDKKYQTFNMVNNILKQNVLFLEYVDPKFQTQEMVNKCFTDNPKTIKFINKNLITEEMCNNSRFPFDNVDYKKIPNNFMSKYYIRYLFNSRVCDDIKLEIFNYITIENILKKFININEIISLIDNNIFLIKYLPENIINTPEIYNVFINNNISIKYFNPLFLTYELVIGYITRNKSIIDIPIQFQTDDFLKYSLLINPENIKYIKRPEYLIKNNLCSIKNKEFSECVICNDVKKYFLKYKCSHEICFDCNITLIQEKYYENRKYNNYHQYYSMCYYNCNNDLNNDNDVDTTNIYININFPKE